MFIAFFDEWLIRSPTFHRQLLLLKGLFGRVKTLKAVHPLPQLASKFILVIDISKKI